MRPDRRKCERSGDVNRAKKELLLGRKTDWPAYGVVEENILW